MELLEGKAEDTGKEKHPVIERKDEAIRVKVSSTPHPMDEKHYIEWVEILVDGRIYRKHLKPGDKPEAEFLVKTGEIIAREYCSIHGF